MNLTTTMAADKLGVSRRRVIALIEEGRLPAEKFGRDYVIQESDLALVAERKPGRPKKSSEPTPSAPIKPAKKKAIDGKKKGVGK